MQRPLKIQKKIAFAKIKYVRNEKTLRQTKRQARRQTDRKSERETNRLGTDRQRQTIREIHRHRNL
jgi:hypothetical protein